MSESTEIVVVDGQKIVVPSHFSLMQACEMAGAEIPRFCFHERLSVAGNCRMCLVEWQGYGKPIASCVQPVKGMTRYDKDGNPIYPIVNTDSEFARKAREGIMEFLLINHPLDCPICDQGGECDLQDQAMAYGRADSRYKLNKRAVEDKNMGPLVKTVMTRCIQCTRCVRFATEIAGVEEVGMISRGEDAEITTYLEKSLQSELSGNVIDLCPVGALTSKPYAFNARPWELRNTESIDVMDALGSAIRIDSKGSAVMRILPVENDDINQEWISDKTRFIWDGLARQRLDRPFLRKDGRLGEVDWKDALEAAASAVSSVKPDKVGVVAGDLVEVEQVKAALDLFRSLSIQNTDCRPVGAQYGKDGIREKYILNPKLSGIEQADVLLLIGANPRLEAAVWNARIRSEWLWNGLEIGLIGEQIDLTYDYTHLGDNPQLLVNENTFFTKLKNAKCPMIVVGENVLTREDGQSILDSALKLALDCGALNNSEWNGFGVLHSAAGRVGALDVGFVPGENGLDTQSILSGKMETVVLLGADEVDLSKLKDSTVIYIGHHGDRGAECADIILPCTAYTEMNATYVNTEGCVQQTKRAVQPKGMAREGWKIFRALSELVDAELGYDDHEQLYDALCEQNNAVFGPGSDKDTEESVFGGDSPSQKSGEIQNSPLKNSIDDFYLTNPIARASKTMVECSQNRKSIQNKEIGS